MSLFLSFLCLLPIFIVSFFILSKKLKTSKWKLPPSPSSLPIIGNLHHLTGVPHRCIHRLCIKYGPVMLLRLGSMSVVVISSSEAAEEVVKTYDLQCCTRLDMVVTKRLSYGFKDITFGPYSEYWREMRKVAVIELFSLKKVQSFRHIREEEVELMAKKVSALTQSPVDLRNVFFSFAGSIVSRVAMGRNFHDCDFINQKKMEELVADAGDVLGNFTFTDLFPAGGIGRSIDWLVGKEQKLNKVFKKLDDFYQHVIDDHLKESSGRETSDSPMDIVAVMLDIIGRQGTKDYFKLDYDNIKAVLMDVFLAGIDTSVITMIWTMTELARNPRVMKKLQEEIRTTLGTEKKIITEQDLNKVAYLQLVIKETFRLHPPVPVVTRKSMAHVKIQGYDIPPGTAIQLNVYTIGRDPKHWTDPEDYIPERFADSSIDFRGQNYNLLPFGSGRRICPGISMSTAAIEMALLSMLYFFDWRLPDGMKIDDIDMEEIGTLSVFKKVPLMLVPVPRP
ncbi:unnamed protein product [Microthlaspi erraticum]|uniref:Cytochrome P450 n=1 Tax=Microthlaspi erraticum TaxID=1685480 RepID=A0A6D2JRF0_9BRAS|nr:unnamed protein product [Microthlaspi erraticum]